MENTSVDNQAIPTSSDTFVAPESSQNSGVKIAQIAGLLLVLILVGLGSYYFGLQQGQRNLARSKISPEVEPQVITPVDQTPPPETASISAVSWLEYEDESEGYKFKYASDHLVYIPSAEGSHRYGVFNSQQDADACAKKSSLVDECDKADYFVLIGSFNNSAWPQSLNNLANQDSYKDMANRDWILSSIEVEGSYRIEGFLKPGDLWYRVVLEVPLRNKAYETWPQADALAKATFDSFKPRN